MSEEKTLIVVGLRSGDRVIGNSDNLENQASMISEIYGHCKNGSVVRLSGNWSLNGQDHIRIGLLNCKCVEFVAFTNKGK